MVTLTRITDPLQLDEYFRFRYRIYSKSRLKSIVAEVDDLDKDVYDDRAHHYGWYVNGKLEGCIRFVEPDNGDTPIPMLTHMTDPEAVAAIHAYVAERKANGQPMIEASRFCLAPEHRGLRTAREFVLAMVATMQLLDFEHGIFDCRADHGPFYKRIGFEQLGTQASYDVQVLQNQTSMFHYNYRALIAQNEELLARMQVAVSTKVKKAA